MTENNGKTLISFRTPLSTREKLEKLRKDDKEPLSDVVNRVVNTYFRIIEDLRKSGGAENGKGL